MVKFSRNTTSRRMRAILIALLILAVAALVLFILEKRQVTDLISRPGKSQEQIEGEARTTSTVPTAQEDYNEGGEREPGNTIKENQGTGNVQDTNGTIPGNINTNNPISSSSGEISVYSPQKDSSVRSGTVLAGTSSLDKVSYRLIDDVSGVIALGELNVVNGKFSGSINFSTSASNGRLDIYATRTDGSEYSNIEIPIRFN